MSKNSPPLMFGAETSKFQQSQNVPPLISVLKLLRKLNVASALITVTPGRSRTLSLIPSWSATKALLGGLSDMFVDVAHITPSPGSGLLATQPAGNAGAVTPSKFSPHSSGVGPGVG